MLTATRIKSIYEKLSGIEVSGSAYLVLGLTCYPEDGEEEVDVPPVRYYFA